MKPLQQLIYGIMCLNICIRDLQNLMVKPLKSLMAQKKSPFHSLSGLMILFLKDIPGSNSPSGYKSDVVLIDKAANIEKPFMIFMNNILKYKGYRFYQSSYDPDEKGTILSVNHDLAGMLVTYTGYGLLFLFIILSLLNRKSVFHNVNAGYWNSALRKKVPVVIILLFLSGLGNCKCPETYSGQGCSRGIWESTCSGSEGKDKTSYSHSVMIF